MRGADCEVAAMVRWLCLCGVLVHCAMPARAALPVAAATGERSAVVAQLTLDGPIGPAAAEYFDDASSRAVASGAAAIVLRLDTPGGLAESMRQIITRMLACPIPILVYVAPEGARAASAGAYILYAGQIAAMAPATHVGAATPVSLEGGTPLPVPKDNQPPASAASAASAASPANAAGAASAATHPTEPTDAESQKVLNDSIAYIRSLAQLRGRDAHWAEQAVRGAATLTANEALQQHVIDFVATSLSELLAKASGRKVEVGDRTVTLQLEGASIRDYPPSARSQFLAIITNPAIAYALLLVGVMGLFLEATHPGVFLPGIVGGICLLVGLYALQLLPVSYAGLALMALGIGLLAAEAVLPTVGALGIGGVIAFVVGSVMLMRTGVPGYGVNLGIIAAISVCALGSLALIVRALFRARRSRQFIGDEALLNERVELLEPIAAGSEGWASVRGERWRVRSESALPAGARVRITQRQGLVLWVAPTERGDLKR
jgi:membrane-bound serine protease (ClpP class)